MEEKQPLAEVKKLISEAKNILLVTHGQTNFDAMGSLLAVYLGLSSLDKQVIVACPDPMTVEFSSFVGANKVKTAIANKNFVISLDYQEGSIEKVSYNIEGEKFNLVIEPRNGFVFSKDSISYSSSGSEADVIIVIDTIHLGLLGSLYEENKELFATKPIINIDAHEENKRYGHVNIVETTAATAELAAVVLSSLGVTLTEDIATNLLNGVYEATQNFEKPLVNARTFEVASVCMKAGGKRFFTQLKKEKETSVVENVIAEQHGDAAVTPAEEHPQSPPEDWLKPKIFKSSSVSNT